MKKYLLLLLFTTFWQLHFYAQQIDGRVVDENNNPLEYASILLLLKVDSTMIAFTNSDRGGNFKLIGVKASEYQIQLSYLGYETLNVQLSMTEKDQSVGTMAMKSATQMLDVLEVKEYVSPITFGKDTMQYNAAAFKIKPGDMAEDLLKKLPGVEVQRDGSVKALGEKVQKVYVDGKEFFGSDTKIATKNIDADAIDKVQVFDKRSERAEFTGVDDGQRERSINLKLKEDKKVGYFGTAEVAVGDKERFKGRANLNRFTPNMRSSFIGMANNVNEQNFSINEYIDFMGGIGSMLSGGGGGFNINLNEDGGLPIGLENNQGVQKSFASGYNLTTDFSSKTSLETSFFANHFNNTLFSNSTRENISSQANFFTKSYEDQVNLNTAGNYTLKFKSKLDSFQRLVVKSSGSLGKNKLISMESNELLTDALLKINDNTNEYSRYGNNRKFVGDVLWQMKFRQKGRSVSFNVAGNFSDQNADGDLKSLYSFYLPTFRSNTILQQQNNDNGGTFFNFTGSFTEPIKAKSFLELKSSFSNQTNRTSSDYYDIVNESPILNTLLTSLYNRDYFQFNNGLSYIFSQDKINVTVGGRLKKSTLVGEVNELPAKIQKRFTAILPNAQFTYRIGMSENFNLSYTSELNEPSLRQLQPFVNNSNPLAIFQGNVNLRAEQMHNTRLSYMRYNAFNFTMMYFSLSSIYTHNKITEALHIDNDLVRRYQPLNVNSESTSSTRFEYESPIRPFKIKTRMVINANYNKGYYVINDIINQMNRFGFGYNFSIENRNKDVVDMIVGYKNRNMASKYNENEEQNQSYYESVLYSEFGLNFNNSVTVKSNLDYTTIKPSFQQSVTSFPLWSATLTSFVTKDKKLRATLTCFDLLNKNRGIRASSNLNFSEIINTNVLGRYILIGLAYNIKGFQKKSGVEIDMGGRD